MPVRSKLIRLLLLMAVIASAWTCCAADLQTFAGARLVPTEWADGDSFLVRFPDGTEHTIRLYGADCIEWHVTDDADADRLRDQRGYFGIFGYGATPVTSIALAKSFGEAAAGATRALLAASFTVHTAFADARGDARYQRIYAFITTADGQDLATILVARGLARAFGVYRRSPAGLSRDDYREQLRDTELLAARNGLGIWAKTDWSALAQQRQTLRAEGWERKLATGKAEPAGTLDINTAARDELLRLPGVGAVTATAIIARRPYTSIDDLLRVRGIGPKLLDKIRPWIDVPR